MAYLSRFEGASFKAFERLDPPAFLDRGAQFGASFASWAPRSGAFDVAPLSPPHWVAIGAPGADHVFLYGVDPSSEHPLFLLGALPAPQIIEERLDGRRFGFALVAGDFNGDGLGDLAVGAPDDNSALPNGDLLGRVVVYRGNVEGPYKVGAVVPLDLKEPLVLHSKPKDDHAPDSFRAALAAGPIFGAVDAAGEWRVDGRDGLVVGAPLSRYEETEDGAAYTFRFLQLPGASLGPVAVLRGDPVGIDRGHFGAAVAVGNVVAVDSLQREDTEAALAPEVLVGVPGMRAPGEESVGQVLGYVNNQSNDHWGLLGAQTRSFSAQYEGIGASIAVGYVQDSPWADLVIGMPKTSWWDGQEDGGVFLTKALPTADPDCVDLVGHWEAEDAAGDPVELRVTTNQHLDTTTVTFLDDYHLAFHHGGDPTAARCAYTDPEDGTTQSAVFSVPAGIDILLRPAYACPGSCLEQVFEDVPVGKIIDSLADTSEQGTPLQDLLLSATGTVGVSWQAGWSPCAVEGREGVSLDLTFPQLLMNGLALMNPALEADCQPVPVRAFILSHEVCE
ncbi:MAG: FG-GAP repeat protein [Deltaproteobacteria bacterium]|nr:FG-GAP repeat protein [Deltaproteobacteria bacterium]